MCCPYVLHLNVHKLRTQTNCSFSSYKTEVDQEVIMKAGTLVLKLVSDNSFMVRESYKSAKKLYKIFTVY